MRHPRSILASLVIGVLALATAAQAGGLPTLAGFQRDRAWTKGSGNEALRVAVTYAKPIGNKYVAYVKLTWGNLTPGDNDNDGHPFQQWKGELEVKDDGEAVVVSTESFESKQVVSQSFDTVAYNQALRRWQQKHQEVVKDSLHEREKDRKKAFGKIKNRNKLAVRLAKIDQEHAARLNVFNARMQNALANLRNELTNQVTVKADRITKDDDDKIAWKSTTYGDSDGLLIKLILEDDDTDVKIKVGDLKVNFETKRDPATETYTVNTNYRRDLYGSQPRSYSSGTTVYRSTSSPTAYCPPTSTYSRSVVLPRTVVYRSTYPTSHYRSSSYRRSGISVNGGWTWSNGGLQVTVGSSPRTHYRRSNDHSSRSRSGHRSSGNNRDRNQNRNDRDGRNNRRRN
jgi:hypothetical protein